VVNPRRALESSERRLSIRLSTAPSKGGGLKGGARGEKSEKKKWSPSTFRIGCNCEENTIREEKETGMTYWEIMVAESSKIQLRRQMVRVGREDEVSEAARRFGTSRNTVRKWRDRFEEEGVRGLSDRSRAPNRIPHKTPQEIEQHVLSLRDRYPNWGADRLGVHFELGCSGSAVARILRQAGRRRRRGKKRIGNDLRAEKARLKPFEKIQIDTKDLSDIRPYATPMRLHRLPRYQYSARDVRTGAAWFAFANTNDSLSGYLLGHLRRHSVPLNTMTVQTDNGVEYIGHMDKRKAGPALFEEVVQSYTGQFPVQIFPGSKTSQSDVEAFHGLIETELYEVEDLSTQRRLLGKARTYQAYFNHVGKNLWKGAKTPAMIRAEAGSNVDPKALTLSPIQPETIPLKPLTPSQGGNDLPNLVTMPCPTAVC
jgi:transposase